MERRWTDRPMHPTRNVEHSMRSVHDHITEFLAKVDGQDCREDVWTYEKGTGGGITRIWERSKFIERGGVNFSGIRGEELPKAASQQFDIPSGTPFFATGVSLVVHPWNPHVPTIHMNIRYFEAGDVWWFGGGIDLTPYYPVFEEIVTFHQTVRLLCIGCGEPYLRHKEACDEYFYNPHRGEQRGVGGIFFDHLNRNFEKNHHFVHQLGMAFPDLYRPLVHAHGGDTWTEQERSFQLHRRSRYVEFNLVYDRGTKFGLQSNGRIESILMSMPAAAEWRYDYQPDPDTPEFYLTDYYLKPRDWVHEKRPAFLPR